LALTTGFPLLDSLISEDKIVEFYSLDRELLTLFYHRVIAVSSPVQVVLVGERGGLDPNMVERFQRIYGVTGEIRVRRAFKVEDVSQVLKAVRGEAVIVDPYQHRKCYSNIVKYLRLDGSRKYIFSFMDREREGSLFGAHSAGSILKLSRTKGGFKVEIIKSVTLGRLEIPFATWEIFGRSESGLIRWII